GHGIPAFADQDRGQEPDEQGRLIQSARPAVFRQNRQARRLNPADLLFRRAKVANYRRTAHGFLRQFLQSVGEPKSARRWGLRADAGAVAMRRINWAAAGALAGWMGVAGCHGPYRPMAYRNGDM